MHDPGLRDPESTIRWVFPYLHIYITSNNLSFVLISSIGCHLDRVAHGFARPELLNGVTVLIVTPPPKKKREKKEKKIKGLQKGYGIS